ncbi:hypothetical protein SNOG_06195 [Parastagonospora nodorum SN15]|uniref:Uncharacterized protein n=1 Tax=Phaeosphaeria nodorum (strain SN15 / ATCC MYA-4574 / FGSC 10173) TaxID=321614 RepID=Q0UPW9_PHANO|nr:hypothetical protein SNOG_06195 [Parastagonospora nodorum SN15]EAT86026.1 hypothetical protein SNOG_06195 [Parastagonospora nodorum SN15]
MSCVGSTKLHIAQHIKSPNLLPGIRPEGGRDCGHDNTSLRQKTVHFSRRRRVVPADINSFEFEPVTLLAKRAHGQCLV